MFNNYYYDDSPHDLFEGPDLRNLYSGLWKVLRPIRYKDVTISEGFESDLFSVPRLARWAYPKSMRRGNVAAILHDFMLVEMSDIYTREEIDDYFLSAMRDAGVSDPRMKIIYLGVAGYTAWLRSTKQLPL